MERQFVLTNFPNIKLCYEKIIHNKVSSDFILAIPHGPKCFIWFTEYNHKNTCFLIELGDKKTNGHECKDRIQNVRILNNSGNCNNTVLYGTYTSVNINKNKMFFVENIYYYNGMSLENHLWLSKFNIIGNLFENAISRQQFCMPLVHNNYEELVKLIEKNNNLYKIHNICFRLKNKNGSLVLPYSKINVPFDKVVPVDKPLPVDKPILFDQSNILNILYNTTTTTNTNTTTNIIKPKAKVQIKEQVMLVKPDLQNDIYHLYSYDDSSKTYSIYQNIAAIPDYKTSVLMNKLFRNIKENNNLDALEESDDEEEFENNKEDRFVFLEKECKMRCVYNYKFKKWTPTQIYVHL